MEALPDEVANCYPDYVFGRDNERLQAGSVPDVSSNFLLRSVAIVAFRLLAGVLIEGHVETSSMLSRQGVMGSQ